MAVTIEHPSTEPDEQQETEVLAPAQVFDSKTLALLQKGEIDMQIATAKQYPRPMTKVMQTAMQLVTQDAETAEECIYALPRAGKIIEGPSVRFAEVLAHAYGNNRCGARPIGEDQEFVTAMGTFFDLENNVAVAYEVKRRITDRSGNRFNSDMITVTANAACSIALRNAVLRGIPKPLWKKLYAAARSVVAGDLKTLDVRRTAMLKTFQLVGVKPEQIYAKLEVKGLEEITLEHLTALRGLLNAIRENEISPDRAFTPEAHPDTKLAEKSKSNLDQIKKKYEKPVEAPTEKSGAAEVATKEAAPEATGAAASAPAAAPTDKQSDDKGKTDSAQAAGPEKIASVEGDSGTSTPADATSGPASEPVQNGIPLNFDEK
jgi:hypothetical protein